MSIPRRIGVILAAGRGRRMGRTKQLAMWPTPNGPKALVAAAFDAIRPICNSMLVVLGHESDAVAAVLRERSFQSVRADADAPMFESVRAGLRAAQAADPKAGVVLHPGDHPQVDIATLKILAAWSLKRPVHAIIPEHGGRGGHPALIPPNVIDRLLESDCPTGLGDFWAAHPQLCQRIAVEDASVLRDVDTLADLPE